MVCFLGLLVGVFCGGFLGLGFLVGVLRFEVIEEGECETLSIQTGR